MISTISMWGLSSLNLFLRTLVSSSIFSPFLPITRPGREVETFIFSPTGVYSIITVLILPLPREFFKEDFEKGYPSEVSFDGASFDHDVELETLP